MHYSMNCTGELRDLEQSSDLAVPVSSSVKGTTVVASLEGLGRIK